MNIKGWSYRRRSPHWHGWETLLGAQLFRSREAFGTPPAPLTPRLSALVTSLECKNGLGAAPHGWIIASPYPSTKYVCSSRHSSVGNLASNAALMSCKAMNVFRKSQLMNEDCSHTEQLAPGGETCCSDATPHTN